MVDNLPRIMRLAEFTTILAVLLLTLSVAPIHQSADLALDEGLVQATGEVDTSGWLAGASGSNMERINDMSCSMMTVFWLQAPLNKTLSFTVMSKDIPVTIRNSVKIFILPG